MTPESVTPTLFVQTARDGVNQAGRVQSALAPDYVAVDERSLRDLLTFAGAYAKEIRFFDVKDGQVQTVGDWQAFLGTATDLDEMVTFLQDPASLSPAQAARYTQPHVVLFLTFLDLLQQTRSQLNDFTRRHLEFYYREALRLTAKPAQPDQLHALIELADHVDQFDLPAGTLLAAGKDSLGLDRFYRTEQAGLINRAQVASLKSLFVQKQVFGLREARQDPIGFGHILQTQTESKAAQTDPFLLMLMLALGEPNPGDPLPSYPDQRTLPPTDAPAVDEALLKKLDTLLDFIRNDLGLSLAAFRTLMELKQKQEGGMAEWKDVNAILTTAGKKRQGDFALNPDTPQDFEANLKDALDVSAADSAFFGALAEVNDIYDLYRVGQRPERSVEVKTFVETNFYMSFAQFNTMMAIMDKVYNNRRQIYAILRTAARKKQRQHTALGSTELHADTANQFDTILKATLGSPDFSPLTALALTRIEDCYQALLALEAYFSLPAEDFAFLRTQFRQEETGPALQPWEWAQVDAILERAQTEKLQATRYQALQKKLGDGKADFEAMICFALGDPAPDNKLPDARDFMTLDPGVDAQYIQQQLYLELENFKNIQSTARENIEKKLPATDKAWATVYKAVELAQRRKRGTVESRPQIEIWENVYGADDAAQVQVQRGLPEESATPRWRTFGDGYRPETTPGRIGFALASPLLALAEGTRTITLTLRFDSDSPVNSEAFRFWLSTEKQMVEVTPALPSPLSKNNAPKGAALGLQVILRLDPQAPPVAPLAVESGLDTPWPTLHILLADSVTVDEAGKPQRPQKRYPAFQSLALTKVELKVEVTGITQLTLQNDDGVLNAKKPFEPFGFAPVVGSNFSIAHPEICTKRLDRLNMKIEWLGAPANFNAYYDGYKDYLEPTAKPDSPIADNASFKAKLKLYDNRDFFYIKEIPLFQKPDARSANEIVINDSELKAKTKNDAPNLDLVIAEEVLDWNRYWQLELGAHEPEPPEVSALDFQHAIYPHAAAGCARKVDDKGAPEPFIINPPYTPKIKRLTLGYSASGELTLAEPDPAAAMSLYHLEPFGYHELSGGADTRVAFLPQYPDEGELFIGLTALAPPQRLSLLVQVAEGSADPTLPSTPVQWWYLSGNRWLSLEQGQLLADETNGLRNTGLITFDLPAAAPNTRMPTALYWLRATIAQNSRNVGDLVAIHTQAVRAVFVDQGNAPDHLNQPLPPATITRLAEPDPAVKAIRQPYSSSGGRGAEQPSHFYTRVSERLRHKNRALTSWDYERLVLEAFPAIYKVKCLPVGASADPRLADQMQIIVIPDIRGKLPFDPFEPKAATDTLAAITAYLQSQSSPFARFMVKNPSYVRLKVRMGVRFRAGYNAGWASATLQQDLQRYLAPWAYDQSAEIVFGGTINANLIVNFAERLPYVEYVAGIMLFTRPEGASTHTPVGAQYTVPPDAIPVSDRQHEIDAISTEVYQQEFFTGINYMQIELDFQVA